MHSIARQKKRDDSCHVFVCNSVPFPGDYGFEIAFEQQNKDTKSITWTVFCHFASASFECTSSSAVANRPRNASCLSVVS